jgi:hypothetical protein
MEKKVGMGKISLNGNIVYKLMRMSQETEKFNDKQNKGVSVWI